MHRTICLGFGSLLLLSACTNAPAGLETARLPLIHSSSSDCEPISFDPSLSIATWVGSADDVIEGTVVEVRAAWTPLVSRDGLVDDPMQCGRVLSALDLVLTDVVSRKDGTELGDQTIRLGSGTLQLWEHPLSADPGSPEIEWTHAPAPLVAGMRIGGAIYDHAHVDLPVFMTGRHQPLYEVVNGTVRFQEPSQWECDTPFPDVAAMNGKTPEDLGALLEASLADAAVDAEAFRAWLGVDDPTFNSTAGFSYGAYCYDVSGVE